MLKRKKYFKDLYRPGFHYSAESVNRTGIYPHAIPPLLIKKNILYKIFR